MQVFIALLSDVQTWKSAKNEPFYTAFICFEAQANVEQNHNLNMTS